MTPLRLVAAAALSLFASQALAVGSLVDLVVFDRTANMRLPVYWHDGRAHVAGKPGNEYTVSVRSRQGAEVLAVVSVDGVNVITGETAHAQQSGYVMAPYRTVDIRGWRKNMAETAAFYFTALGDSYAARTGRPDHVGVIGVAVFRKKPIEQPQPFSRIAPAPLARESAGASADAAAPAREAKSNGEFSARAEAGPRAPIGTGHGRRETSHARHVSFERASDVPAETVALYYDSRENLVARGVIRDTVPIAPRRPSPFPGFVPDPVSTWQMPPVRPSFGG